MKRIVVKQLIVFGALIIGLALFCGSAAAAMVVTKTDKVKVEVSGQINRAVLDANDGDEDDFYHVDNDNNSTQIDAKATAKPNDTVTVGAHLEYEYESNAGNKMWQELSDTDDDEFADRTIEVFVQCRFGKLSLGQGKTASDGTTEVDLSGTKVVDSGMRKDESSAREDAICYYGKIGYIAQLFDLGSTAFAIDYGRFKEMKVNDDKGDTIGVQAVQNLENWNTEVYFGYRHYELDRTDTDFDDIDIFMSGIRINF